MVGKYKNLIDAFKTDDDFIGLWELIGCVEESFSPASPLELKNAVLELVLEMLAEGFVAGQLERSDTGYAKWENQNPDDVVKRISQEWDALGRIPNIGDVVYFDLP